LAGLRVQVARGGSDGGRWSGERPAIDGPAESALGEGPVRRVGGWVVGEDRTSLPHPEEAAELRVDWLNKDHPHSVLINWLHEVLKTLRGYEHEKDFIITVMLAGLPLTQDGHLCGAVSLTPARGRGQRRPDTQAHLPAEVGGPSV
jgi:hypothetical protein